MAVAAAREQAEKYHAQVKLGGDPQQEKADIKTRSDETFEACMKLYLERRRTDGKLRASSYGEIERHLVKNLAPLHGLHIAKVDRRAIALELGRLTNGSPVQANRTRASLVKFLNWCAGEGFIDANPAVFTNIDGPDRAALAEQTCTSAPRRAVREAASTSVSRSIGMSRLHRGLPCRSPWRVICAGRCIGEPGTRRWPRTL